LITPDRRCIQFGMDYLHKAVNQAVFTEWEDLTNSFRETSYCKRFTAGLELRASFSAALNRDSKYLLRRASLLLVIGIGYGVVGILLYRERVVSMNPLWDTDLLVFASPTLLAFAMFMWRLWPRRSSDSAPTLWSRVSAVGLAALATAVCCLAYMNV